MSIIPTGSATEVRREPNDETAAAEEGSVPALVPSRRYAVSVPMRLVLPSNASRRAREILRRQRTQGRHSKLAVLQVCAEFEESRQCREGERCGYLHLSELSTQLGRLPIHVNTKLPSLDDAPFNRLPPGCTIPLWNASKTHCSLYDSRYLYATKGALDAYRMFSEAAAPPDTSKVRMQHCSHYQGDMCIRGDDCNFIHVAYVPGAPNCPDPTSGERDGAWNVERHAGGMPPPQRASTIMPFAPNAALPSQLLPPPPNAVGWSPFPMHVLHSPAQYDARVAPLVGPPLPYYVPLYMNPAQVLHPESLPAHHTTGFALAPQPNQPGGVFLVAQPTTNSPAIVPSASAVYLVANPNPIPQVGLPGSQFSAARRSTEELRRPGQGAFPPPT